MNRPPSKVAVGSLALVLACAGGDPLDDTDGMEDTDSGGDYGVCTPSGRANSDPFVDCIEVFEPQNGADFGHAELPEVIYGPPEGRGDGAGGTPSSLMVQGLTSSCSRTRLSRA